MIRRALPFLLALPLAACGHHGGGQSPDQVAKEMAGFKMRPGQWQTTLEILSATAPGIPPASLRSLVGSKNDSTSCVTAEQAAKPTPALLAGQQGNDCSYENFSARDGRMSGKMTCGGGVSGKKVVRMAGEYSPVAYEMTMDMDVGLPGGMTAAIKARSSAHRVGDCA